MFACLDGIDPRSLVLNRRRQTEAFQHVISMGTSCYTAWLIKALDLRRASYPFDWIFSHPAMAANMLDDRFARFLDPCEHAASPDGSTGSNPPRCEHLGYRERYGIANVFNHHDVTTPVVLDHFKRSVDRFLAVTGGNEKVLLLMVNTAAPVFPDQFRTLGLVVDSLGPRNTLLCINVGCTGDSLDMGMGEPFQLGRHRLRTYRSTSEINGVSFTNPLDDLVLRSVVAQFSFDVPVVVPFSDHLGQ